MDSFATADPAQGQDVPDKLTALFEDAAKVKVQPLPCELADVGSKAVHVLAGARTRPHRHTRGQHIVVVSGTGVVADEEQVRIVRAGDVISSPPGAWQLARRDAHQRHVARDRRGPGSGPRRGAA